MFRILSFTIHTHALLGGKKFELANPEEATTNNYYSIIIGPNGTGKSYLLSNLIGAFNEAALMKKSRTYKPNKEFTLEYKFGRNKFKISTENSIIRFENNGEIIKSSQIKLPKKWMASSVTINDKYPILNSVRSKQIPQYEYLGIRSATNNAFISKITTNTVLDFIEALAKGRYRHLETIYKSLGLNTELQIVFSKASMLKLPKRRNKYFIYRTPKEIIAPHISFINKNKGKTSYRADRYKKYLNDEKSLNRVYEFLLLERSKFEKDPKSETTLTYEIGLHNKFGIAKLLSEWDALSIMLDLELITISKFHITKNAVFDYESASSGESHLLTSFHGIIANLEDYSLLVIDEPEISLHPNWQIDYLVILKKILRNYKNIFTVIATHSNLMISSLHQKESRIITMKRVKRTKDIVVDELDFETYGWDPESILYNVFEVANVRNKYFELDLRKLISLIAKQSKRKKDIEKLKNKLAKFIIPNQSDPLRLLIKQAENYLKK